MPFCKLHPTTTSVQELGSILHACTPTEKNNINNTVCYQRGKRGKTTWHAKNVVFLYISLNPL
jgi:hypothetical protein